MVKPGPVAADALETLAESVWAERGEAPGVRRLRHLQFRAVTRGNCPASMSSLWRTIAPHKNTASTDERRALDFIVSQLTRPSSWPGSCSLTR
jgi:hypothetical protein